MADLEEEARLGHNLQTFRRGPDAGPTNAQHVPLSGIRTAPPPPAYGSYAPAPPVPAPVPAPVHAHVPAPALAHAQAMPPGPFFQIAQPPMQGPAPPSYNVAQGAPMYTPASYNQNMPGWNTEGGFTHIPPARLEELKYFMTDDELAVLRGDVQVNSTVASSILNRAAQRERRSFETCVTPCRASDRSSSVGRCLISMSAGERLRQHYPEAMRTLSLSQAGQYVSSQCRVDMPWEKRFAQNVRERLTLVKQTLKELRPSRRDRATATHANREAGTSSSRLAALADASLGLGTYSHSTRPGGEKSGRHQKHGRSKQAEGVTRAELMVRAFRVPQGVARALASAPLLDDDEMKMMTAAFYDLFHAFRTDMGQVNNDIDEFLRQTAYMARWKEHLANLYVVGGDARGSKLASDGAFPQRRHRDGDSDPDGDRDDGIRWFEKQQRRTSQTDKDTSIDGLLRAQSQNASYLRREKALREVKEQMKLRELLDL